MHGSFLDESSSSIKSKLLELTWHQPQTHMECSCHPSTHIWLTVLHSLCSIFLRANFQLVAKKKKNTPSSSLPHCFSIACLRVQHLSVSPRLHTAFASLWLMIIFLSAFSQLKDNQTNRVNKDFSKNIYAQWVWRVDGCAGFCLSAYEPECVPVGFFLLVCVRVSECVWSFHTWAPPNSAVAELLDRATWQSAFFSSPWLMACWRLVLMKMRSPPPARLFLLCLQRWVHR